jgi:hypothetical protein
MHQLYCPTHLDLATLFAMDFVQIDLRRARQHCQQEAIFGDVESDRLALDL